MDILYHCHDQLAVTGDQQGGLEETTNCLKYVEVANKRYWPLLIDVGNHVDGFEFSIIRDVQSLKHLAA